MSNDTQIEYIDDKKKYNLFYSNLILDIAQNQSRESFKLLYQEFYPRIKAYLRSINVGHEAVDDLAQDVMTTIWRKAGQYNHEKAAPVTWIFTISRNRFIDTHIRKKKHIFTEEDASFFMNDVDDPSGNLNRINNTRMLEKIVSELSSEQAELIKMVYFQEKTHSEVAQITKLPLGTVKSRIRTALANIRKLVTTQDFKDY